VKRALAWGGLLVLLVGHLDFWRPRSSAIHFGWMPSELAYRLVWMLLAWLYLWIFTRFVWRREE